MYLKPTYLLIHTIIIIYFVTVKSNIVICFFKKHFCTYIPACLYLFLPLYFQYFSKTEITTVSTKMSWTRS